MMTEKDTAPKAEKAAKPVTFKLDKKEYKFLRTRLRYRGFVYTAKEAVKTPEVLQVLVETQWDGIEEIKSEKE